MTLTVVWSVQARSQFVATLTYIAKEDPLTVERVHERVDKSLKLLCDSPDEPTPYPKQATALTIGWCEIKSGFNAGTGNGKSLSLL